MKGWLQRDEEGRIIIDSNGYVTIQCEEEDFVFQVHLSEIDVNAEQMCFTVNDKEVYFDVYPFVEMIENEHEPGKVEERTEERTDDERMIDERTTDDQVDDEQIDERLEEERLEEDDRFATASTSKNGNAIFPWCDASTKIFLKEYKQKKELVKNRKLKNMKVAYQQISQSLQKNGFNVSPLQVENRFKTLKRAYKNMIIHNRRNGRGKYIYSYEQDLDEIFSYKEFLADLQDGEVNEEGTDLENSTSNNEADWKQNVRLEAQHAKMIENLQNCQRTLKALVTKMDNRSKSVTETQNKVLQICTEIRDMQKEASARTEEHRQKATKQREMKNNLLQEILAVLKSKKEV
ncbi:stress response protein nst1-like isoform X2 [Pseudomyrmex gracilis]|uniref:stress response protein nst1-like isoform X2 n=1 Tax=Pseudomyrmex gracilis TaxID=219809 RepID=UPI000995D899|nr:stress response protein nst1-like isoform X2 [Pseudomyrmex gracilis]